VKSELKKEELRDMTAESCGTWSFWEKVEAIEV
jgi:hypothetical protein